jgi:hypothetical protein
MRNDARPIGHEAPHSAVQNPHEDDARGSDMHDRRDGIVNAGRDAHARRGDAGVDPAMPADDATLKIRI